MTLRHIARWVLERLRPWTRRLALAPQVLLEEMPDHPALFDQYRWMIATGHKRTAGGWIYCGEFYPDYLTMGGATFAIRRTAEKYCTGKGLDIGAGFWPLPGSIPIDTVRGPGLAQTIDDFPDASQDYVFSSHCLEHIEDWGAALDQWIRKLRLGGVMFLYLPHPSCKLWHRSNPFMAEVHRWVPTPSIVAQALSDRGLELIDRDEGPDHHFSFFICARKIVEDPVR